MDSETKPRVHLAAVSGSLRGSAVAEAKLPLRMANVQHRARSCLRVLLGHMFNHADDALFEMANRAGSNHEQNIYFESMRELRLRRRHIELSCLLGFDAGFERLACDLPRSIAAGEQSLKGQVRPEMLCLVNENEIEERIAVESMVTRTLHAGADELSLLSMRFESLVKGIRVDNDSNPLAPQAVCKAFTDAYSILEIDIKARLFVLKLYEKYVLKELGQLYRELNRELAEEGVLPNISLADQAVRRDGQGRGSDSAGGAMTRRSAADARLGAENDAIFSQLQSLLQRATACSTSSGHKSTPVDARDSVKIVRRTTVLDVISSLQCLQPQLSDCERGYAADLPPLLDVRQLVEEKLNEKGGEGRYELGREDEDAINLVSLLFRFVLEDDNLALPMRSQLGLLQFPIVKVALLDKSFFGENSHPAKKLFNRVAQAGLGWEPAISASRDFLYRKVTQCVKTVLARFEDDPSVFQDVLQDFTVFLENERRRASVVEQRTLEAERGRARAEASRQGVAAVIKRCTADKYVPAVVADLLEHAWSKVLFLLYARDGEGSESWKSAVQVMEELVWSVQPKLGEAERQRLERLAPHLLKSIRLGLSRVGFSYFAMNHFFEQLEVIHRCSLDRQVPMPVQPVAQASPKQASAAASSLDALLSGADRPRDNGDPAVDDIARGSGDESPAGRRQASARERTVAAAEFPDAANEEAFELVDNLSAGSWVQFRQSAEHQYRCRLAAVLKAVDKYIFVNRSGKKVAEWSRRELAANVATKVVVLLDDRQMFDRALEAVIAQLREQS